MKSLTKNEENRYTSLSMKKIITLLSLYFSFIPFTQASNEITVTTKAITNISSTTAIGNGTLIILGDVNPTQYGVVWSTYHNPDISLTTKTTQGVITSTRDFTSDISGLLPNTTYYLRAYATNSVGTSYGNEVSFNTLTLQTISFGNLDTKTYGDAAFNLTASTTATGLTITYLSDNEAVAKISGNTLSIIGVGEANITAIQAGNNIYLAATDVTQKIIVNKRPITITVDAVSKTYGDNDPFFTTKITSGTIITGDNSTGYLTRNVGENVGFYLINKGTYSFGDNYDETFVTNVLSITKRPITITVDAVSKIYGDNDPIFTTQITSGTTIPGDNSTGSLTRAVGETVGDYPISRGTYTFDTNYDETFVGTNLIITKRPITITVDAVSKTYGETDPIFTTQMTSGTIITGDNSTGSLTRAYGETIGNYPISKGTYTYGSNYDENFVGTNLNISKRPITITVDAVSKTYGDTDPFFVSIVTSGTIVSGDNTTGSMNREVGENVGFYAINKGTYSYGDNYSETFESNDLSITKRPITITVDAVSKIFGDIDPIFTTQITLGTIVNGNSPFGALTRDIGENAGNYAINKNSYTFGDNYYETFISKELSITKRPITIAIDAVSKIYGDSDPIFSPQVIIGEIVNENTATGKLSRMAGENVGYYLIKKGTYTFGDNYDETFINNVLNITKRPIIITVDAVSKTYGDRDPDLNPHVISGTILIGDIGTGSLTRAVGETVGSYAINKGTYTFGDNYDEMFISKDLIITKRAITITVGAISKTYGDIDPIFTTQITSGTIVNGNTAIGTLSREIGESVGYYAINKGTYTFGDNYDEGFEIDYLKIEKRKITVTAVIDSKTYDGTNNSTLIPTFGTLVNGDLVNTTPIQAFNNANVGTNHVLTASGFTIKNGSNDATANYNISYVSSAPTAIIHPKQVLVTEPTISTSKVYDGSDIASVTAGLMSGVAAMDIGNVSITAKATYSDASVGTGKIITVKYTLSGSAMANYIAPPDYIYSVSEVEIIRKQLTITEPTVIKNKMFDGNSSAYISKIGNLQGVEIIDVNNVGVVATATYNSNSEGQNKTITVVYQLTGSTKNNYFVPVNSIFTGAKISGNITLETLATSTQGCENSNLELDYVVLTGTPTLYKITFNTDALNAGIKNVVYTNLPTTQNNGILSIPIPKGTHDGTYQGTLQVMNELGIESSAYTFQFTINVSSDIIITKFTDVVLCDNSSKRFTAFQWNKNGEAINGAINQFYCDPDGLIGNYSLKLTTTEGQTLYTCQKVLNIPLSIKVTSYPSPVRASQTCTVKISGIENYELEGAELSVFNVQGIRVFYTDKVEKLNLVSLPTVSGVYIGHLKTISVVDYTFKIFVEK